MSGRWTHPQCEACWIVENAVWAPSSFGDERMTEVRRPVLLREPELERCCTCGGPTLIGLYVRKDPETVPFPSPEED